MKEDFLHLNSWPPGSMTSKLLNRKNWGKNSNWSRLDHMLTPGPITVRRRCCDWFDLDHMLIVWPEGWVSDLISNCQLSLTSLSKSFPAHWGFLCPWMWQVPSAEELLYLRSSPQMTDRTWHINTQGLLPMGWQNFNTTYQKARVGLNAHSSPFPPCRHCTLYLPFLFSVSPPTSFSVVFPDGCCSITKSCRTLQPMDCSTPGSPILHCLLEFAQIHVHWVSNALPPSHPLQLLLSSVFPHIRVFFSQSALHIRWPNYWSFSFSTSPSNEYSGLISIRIDWFDLLAVQGTLESLH